MDANDDDARAQRLASAAAVELLARLLAEGIGGGGAPLCVRTAASCLSPGLRVVVRVTGRTPAPRPAAGPAEVLTRPTDRPVDLAILRAAPGPTERPVTVKRLAALAGYSDTGHFREAVRLLIDAGRLERVRGGVRRRATRREGHAT